MVTSSCIAVFALRIRVSMSAMGSVIVIGLPPPSPTRLGHAGDLAGVRELAQTQAAQREPPVDRSRAAAAAAPRVAPHLELGRRFLLVTESFLGHYCPSRRNG